MDEPNRQIAFMIEMKKIDRLVQDREKVTLRDLPEPEMDCMEQFRRGLLRRLLERNP